MIIKTGGRTDTVQYFPEWFLRRFSEGYVLSRNPLFSKKISRYELDPSVVDCVIFCSKDYRPILSRLHEITNSTQRRYVWKPKSRGCSGCAEQQTLNLWGKCR